MRSGLSSGLCIIMSANASVAAQASSWLPAGNFLPESPSTPDELFNTALVLLGVTILAMRSSKFFSKERGAKDDKDEQRSATRPASVLSLRRRFLPVFWLLRLSFWMTGPYFHQVYASKTFGGVPATPATISYIFLAGFGSIAMFASVMGRELDARGRKRGTVLAALVYSVGALSTASDSLPVLLAGRAVGGLGTNLIGSAPEAWLVGEASRNAGDAIPYLREIFGTAYSYDPLVAVASGQIAGFAARRSGPTGPFMLLPAFCLMGGVIAAVFWEENTASASGADENEEKSRAKEVTVRDGLGMVWDDKKLLMLGAVQSLFEGSMCIFVSQWPPAMAKAVGQRFGEGAQVPYGTVFSCFMASCMVGSTLFTKVYSAGTFLEKHMTKMLIVSALSIAGTLYAVMTPDSLYVLMLGMFSFEACVGMYFPMIGTMRSKYLPNSHRSVIASIYTMPLNLLVVTVFLFIERLGTTGAFVVATSSLATSAICMLVLQRIRSREARRNIKRALVAFNRKLFNIHEFKEKVEEMREEEKRRPKHQLLPSLLEMHAHGRSQRW